MRLLRRKPKPAPVQPAPPLRDPAAQLALDIDEYATKLARAVRDYATAPDSIPATIRADYAAGIAFDVFVQLLAALHAKLDGVPGDLEAERERRDRVLHSLVVTYGLQALLTNAADLAEFKDFPPELAVYDRAEMLAQWVHDSAHLALLNGE